MATEPEKARVTELHVRMDCNGCVQRIKKAVHSIDGVYDAYVDIAQQKLTVVGRADPEKLVKAIRKTRKTATICSHTEQVEPDGSASSSPPATDAANQPPSEAPPTEATPPSETPQEAPPQDNPSPEAQDPDRTQSKDVEEVHMMHHYPHNYVHREHWNNYPPMGHEMRHEAPYYVATHSYNTYRPSPPVSEYGYIRSPPQDVRYYRTEASGDGYYQNRDRDDNQIGSMFSDENPNACRIA